MNADIPRRRLSDTDPANLAYRLELLERRNIAADADHAAFRANDGQTAIAVDKLAQAINDPRTGLIVELAAFRAEVQNDRRVFKAWIAGAAFAISAIFSIITIYAPAIQAALGVKP